MLLSGQKRFDFSLDLCIDRGFRLLIDLEMLLVCANASVSF